MTDYPQEIADLIEGQEIFVVNLSFAEEGIQLEYIDQADQSSSMFTTKISIIPVTTDERLNFYETVQELAVILLRDSIVQHRIEKSDES
jgi:hypothetical protein